MRARSVPAVADVIRSAHADGATITAAKFPIMPPGISGESADSVAVVEF
jgi:hypothetical protein